ncbi:MAG: FxsA family protein [Beijerinckiaceae bacterium]
MLFFELHAMFRRPSYFLTGLMIWLALEIIAFWSIIQVFGILGAFLLALLTTIAGIAILRNLGRGAANALRKTLEGKELASGRMLDGALTALGAVLLILPGFVSDLAGLALAAPSLRQFLARRFGGTVAVHKPPKPDIVDLGPEEWQSIEGQMQKPDKRPKRAKLQDQAADTL